MPPRIRSRHMFTVGYEDDAAPGKQALSERVPFPYKDFADNREHVVKEGDTLLLLAATFFSSLPTPAELWWVIADFQPDPIHDPTITLQPGTTLVIMSERTLIEEVFSEKRRPEGGI